MQIATARLQVKNFDFSSNDPERLLPALRLIFGEDDTSLYLAIAADGVHIVSSLDGINTYGPLLDWLSKPISEVADEIEYWLGHLPSHDARRISGAMPTEQAYTDDPQIALTGYRVMLSRNRGLSHFEVIIIPAWV